jgi:hypothetical protein
MGKFHYGTGRDGFDSMFVESLNQLSFRFTVLLTFARFRSTRVRRGWATAKSGRHTGQAGHAQAVTIA